MTVYRILVCGGRDYKDRDRVFAGMAAVGGDARGAGDQKIPQAVEIRLIHIGVWLTVSGCAAGASTCGCSLGFGSAGLGSLRGTTTGFGNST